MNNLIVTTHDIDEANKLALVGYKLFSVNTFTEMTNNEGHFEAEFQTLAYTMLYDKGRDKMQQVVDYLTIKGIINKDRSLDDCMLYRSGKNTLFLRDIIEYKAETIIEYIKDYDYEVVYVENAREAYERHHNRLRVLCT